MTDHARKHACDCGCDRRHFLSALGAAAGSLALTPLNALAAEGPAPAAKAKEPAIVRAAFVYPPSKSFADRPDGWWSWPGNNFDAEGRQKQFTAAFREMEKRLAVKVVVDDTSVGTAEQAQALAKELADKRPDGLLLVMFYNLSLPHADIVLKAAEAAGVPAIFYIGLGVKHGPVAQYRRPGLYFIQSLDNLDAIEYGLRMIATRKRAAQSLLLSITEAPEPREGTEEFLGTRVRVIPFARYAAEFKKVELGDEAKQLIARFTAGAKEQRGITQEALDNAARAHFALKKLLADEGADGLTMNCLRRGRLKPCMSFSQLNSQLIPAACENDLPAAYTYLLGHLLTGRPGFQHNPCYDTEANHYYGSHCTCPTKLYGPDGPDAPYLLRRFAHTNEGSCAIQVFWKEGDPVTMVRYYPGKPPALDVYAGKVVKSHAMPPAGGCTTNVEVEIADRADACEVKGHHNLLFCGDFARRFRLFAQLYRMRLAATGFRGPWPM
ncbi:MAG TPA: hypothetical protein VNE39_22815 [Planctomycetota bacterium]|nr:hypothetical protein [Planctomycetota bacterium]